MKNKFIYTKLQHGLTGNAFVFSVFNTPLYFLIVLTLLALFATYVRAAEITVSADRNPVSINDSFQLTFTASEAPDGDPDFSPLKQDFDILSQQQSSRSSWINGRFSKTMQWTLTVIAKHSGNLLIPVIAFGNDMSRPLIVQVTQKQTKNNSNDELFLEVVVTPEKPYVQTQVLYTLRFYRRVQITQASLHEPELEDAVIEKLGEDSNYSTQINGITYNVTERKYAIFPQHSGSITIAPLTLTAEVVNNQRPRFNGFFSSRIAKTKRIISRAVTLDVQPIPQKFTGAHWLGAEQVHFEQKWSDDGLQVKVGEPLTRTLTLLAKGVTVGQLPELNTHTGNELLKSYPDQPVLKEQKTQEGLIAFREEKVAYIPSKPGKYVLPEIKISWFNTQTQKVEMARLPKITLQAIASVAAEPTKTTTDIETQRDSKQQKQSPILVKQSVNDRFWMWVSLVLASGWVMTVLLFLQKRWNRVKTKPLNEKQIRTKDIAKALKKAGMENNPQAAKEALLQWGKIQFNATSLAAIAAFCEAPLRDEIIHLNQHLYSIEHSMWQGGKLFQAFAENNARQQINQPKEDLLEPLYRI